MSHWLLNKHSLAVFGYVRQEFDKKCMIGVIIDKITCFYKIECGNLLTMGSGACGKLGRNCSIDNEDCFLPVNVHGFDSNNCRDIAAFASHCLCTDDDGKVYAFGENTYGQLGIGTRSHMSVPTLILSFQDLRVTNIAVGPRHSLVVTEGGKCWS